MPCQLKTGEGERRLVLGCGVGEGEVHRAILKKGVVWDFVPSPIALQITGKMVAAQEAQVKQLSIQVFPTDCQLWLLSGD